MNDLNRTDQTTTKFEQYSNLCENINFEELILDPTCIPIRGSIPTTTPDSVLVKNKYDESVTLLSPETLHSDHLGIMVHTNFPFSDVKLDDNSVHEYYEFDCVDKARKKLIWSPVDANPSFSEVSECFGQLTLMCKRVRKGAIRKKLKSRI